MEHLTQYVDITLAVVPTALLVVGLIGAFALLWTIVLILVTRWREGKPPGVMMYVYLGVLFLIAADTWYLSRRPEREKVAPPASPEYIGAPSVEGN